MKKQYNNPIINITTLLSADVISLSGGEEGNAVVFYYQDILNGKYN